MPRYDRLKAGVSPLPCKRSIRNLHHQRSVRRARRRNQSAKQISSRRSQRRAAIANPFRWFALPSVSGLRLVPSGRPRALGRAHSCASPGIRVSRSGLRREFKTIALQTTKNPPELAGSGGSVRTDVSMPLTRDRSHEPGRRYRSACSRSTVLRDFSKIRSASSRSCLLANAMFA
jgi:hypothetical protein